MSTLILVRHGQSEWNLANRFTGWWDVDLTDKGVEEARAAGRLLKDKGVLPDIAFTSLQTRAIRTLNLALEECGRLWIPVTKDWHLNERHYGGLNGLVKQQTRGSISGAAVSTLRPRRWSRAANMTPARTRATKGSTCPIPRA